MFVVSKNLLLPVFVVALGLARADELPASPIQVPLVVSAEVPLRVYLTQRLPMRNGEAVHAKLIEPVYAFDRIVLPAGVDVEGTVTRLDPVSKWRRFQAIVQGDLTPLHWARVAFTTVRMPDGRLIPIQTADSIGLSTLYTPPRPAPAHAKKKSGSTQGNSGILGTARDQAIQRLNAKAHGVIDLVRAPNKKEWLEDFAIKKLPYHPQWYRRSTRFDAVLRSPLDFGRVALPAETLRNVGLPALEATGQVRLLTAVSSADATTNTAVEGVLSQPVFSPDHKLLLPEGTHVTGHVRHAQAARWFHRGGQLRFTFDHIEPPAITHLAPVPLQRMEAQLTSVEADPHANVKVDAEGEAKSSAPKTRLLGPAIALIVAGRSLDNDAGKERVGRSGAEANYGGRVAGGLSGFGLLGAALGRASRTAGSALGVYGLGWSVYSTVISRGNEVEFQKNTAMEIRFGAPAAPPSKKLANPYRPNLSALF